MFHEWIHNAADIDGADVVWAADLGDAENQKLIEYYPRAAPGWSSPTQGHRNRAVSVKVAHALVRAASALVPTQGCPVAKTRQKSLDAARIRAQCHLVFLAAV